MKNSLDLKRFHVRSALSASLKTKYQYTFFMGALKLICSGISQEKFLKTKIDLPVIRHRVLSSVLQIILKL